MQKKLPRRPIACIRKQTRRARWLTLNWLFEANVMHLQSPARTKYSFFKTDILRKTELNGPWRNWQKFQLSQMANNKVHLSFDFLSIWDPSFSVTKMVARLTNHEVLHFLKQLYDPSLRTIFCIMAWKQPDNRDLQKFMRSYQNKKENKSIPNSLIKINNNHFYKEISI